MNNFRSLFSFLLFCAQEFIILVSALSMLSTSMGMGLMRMFLVLQNSQRCQPFSHTSRNILQIILQDFLHLTKQCQSA